METGTIALATNNGDIGGGEVMLLNIARALTELGSDVRIVCPRAPSGVVDSARSNGFQTVALDASTRREYMLVLRHWDAVERKGILWCNGLVPAAATSGHPNRIVHLHQRPHGIQRPLSLLARLRALETIVPSHNMAEAVAGSKVLHNWVLGIPDRQSLAASHVPRPTRLGFLGRPSVDKGVGVLAEALQILDKNRPGSFRLVLAGEPRFVGHRAQRKITDSLRPVRHLVDFTGWIRPEELFEQVDILVCPSIWPEPFGLVVAEAMSARVPFVISDAGALPEIAGPHHPWVFTAGDASDLASVLERAAATNNGSFIENAFWRWKQQFSPDAGKQRVKELLNEIRSPNVSPAATARPSNDKP